MYSTVSKIAITIMLSAVLVLATDRLHAKGSVEATFLLVTGTDTSDTDKKNILPEREPKKALYYSLLLPGAGQVYNGRLWKVPIIYAAIGTSVYFAVENHKTYKDLQTAYELKVAGSDDLIDNRYDHLSAGSLERFRDQYDRWYQTGIFLGVAAWLLNAVEAYTDAHLQNFDIDEKLTLRYKLGDTPPPYHPSPNLQPSNVFGLSLVYTFR